MNSTQQWWLDRGRRDGQLDKPPIFRSTKARGIVARGEWPHDEEDLEEMGRLYLRGYDEAQS